MCKIDLSALDCGVFHAYPMTGTAGEGQEQVEMDEYAMHMDYSWRAHAHAVLMTRDDDCPEHESPGSTLWMVLWSLWSRSECHSLTAGSHGLQFSRLCPSQLSFYEEPGLRRSLLLAKPSHAGESF